MGGTPMAFLNPPSVLIVIAGTVAITVVSFSIKDLMNIPKALLGMLVYRPHNPRDVGVTMIQIAERARSEGMLSMATVAKGLNQEPFLQKGLNLTVDGTKPDEIEKIMQQEINYTSSIQSKSVDLLRRGAEVAPAMGLIGTLIGLVQMLGNLSDPSTIGPAMQVALLTTFYGAVLAHMILLPLASKAERNYQNESVMNSLYMVCVLSIGREENPRRLEIQLNAMLPHYQRITYFD
jgi:chemotaxis protein MotA